MWPDVEALLLERLAPKLQATRPQVRVGAATPDNMSGVWFVRIQVIGGWDDGLTDRSRVDAEAFAPTRADAQDLAADLRTCMLSLAATARPDGTGLVDSVRTESRPAVVPYLNPGTVRVLSTYTVSTRLQ